jgi:hypothetical protein
MISKLDKRLLAVTLIGFMMVVAACGGGSHPKTSTSLPVFGIWRPDEEPEPEEPKREPTFHEFASAWFDDISPRLAGWTARRVADGAD